MATTPFSADLRGSSTRTTVRLNGTAEDYQRILEEVKALPDKSPIVWTKELDEILLTYYKVKRKKDLARIFGVTDRCLYDRYMELTGGRNE